MQRRHSSSQEKRGLPRYDGSKILKPRLSGTH
jgi:hypothetical protein